MVILTNMFTEEWLLVSQYSSMVLSEHHYCKLELF